MWWIVAAVLVAIIVFYWWLFSTAEDAPCNGDCYQGRHCDCCESGLTDEDLRR